MTPPIELFFDSSSPYGYVASDRIDKLAGNAPQHIEAGIQSEDLKRQLCAVNHEARAQGVFGSPFLLINQEPFWGVDRFGHLDPQLSRGSW
ncbi:MAG: hypothetical protein AAEI92_12665 [Arenicellales bacterium]|jgi:2-hydroxychromene-2-carboxylate isomerase